jgi:hypothetical protein
MYRECNIPFDSPGLCAFNELLYIGLWWVLGSAIFVREPFLQHFCCVARTRPLAGILAMRAASPVREVPAWMREFRRNSAFRRAGAGAGFPQIFGTTCLILCIHSHQTARPLTIRCMIITGFPTPHGTKTGRVLAMRRFHNTFGFTLLGANFLVEMTS